MVDCLQLGSYLNDVSDLAESLLSRNALEKNSEPNAPNSRDIKQRLIAYRLPVLLRATSLPSFSKRRRAVTVFVINSVQL